MSMVVPARPKIEATVENAVFVVDDVHLSFGGIVALNALTFSVTKGELCAVIGPNGAGKSSLFNVISGVYKPSHGSVRYRGEEILGRAPHQIAALGVGRTFQNLAVVPAMTVLDNVLLGGHLRYRGPLTVLGGVLRLRGEVKAERRLRTDAHELLERIGLAHLAGEEVSSLSYGWQKRVEIARAMMSKPSLLLVDEPAGGLTQDEVHELGALLRGVRDEFELTMLLVEHHMGLVTSFADRCVVMSAGALIADGRPAEVVRDPVVVAAYLGEDD
ncbi:ABC transporter ATP-binding protein [Amycolatopsis sp. GM8]|uniref:ABC transporter ATP-binding protein n=1 Tax=Amycolatopsis sp. GM8 TaxID=2896530 RepID=UPI001F20960A|nr:ABC transporter ATP-binding protein [Amycolatopsis sp. GM8]